MQTRLGYGLQRLKERMGEQALTGIVEQIYDLAIIEKRPSSRVEWNEGGGSSHSAP